LAGNRGTESIIFLHTSQVRDMSFNRLRASTSNSRIPVCSLPFDVLGSLRPI